MSEDYVAGLKEGLAPCQVFSWVLLSFTKTLHYLIFPCKLGKGPQMGNLEGRKGVYLVHIV